MFESRQHLGNSEQFWSRLSKKPAHGGSMFALLLNPIWIPPVHAGNNFYLTLVVRKRVQRVLRRRFAIGHVGESPRYMEEACWPCSRIESAVTRGEACWRKVGSPASTCGSIVLNPICFPPVLGGSMLAMLLNSASTWGEALLNLGLHVGQVFESRGSITAVLSNPAST